jgi:NodT family efflux transporter outer membrane factor (OMF) lipoprotein
MVVFGLAIRRLMVGRVSGAPPTFSPRGRMVVAVCLVLGACHLGPNYLRPFAPAPEAIKQTAPDAHVWPDRGWWHGFGSADLDRLIASTESDSFDIQAAIARVTQADAQVRISGAALLPSVSASGKQAYQRSYATSDVRGISSRYVDTRTSTAELSASYELDVWGKLAAGRASAQASALFSRYDQQTVALTTISSVATTWFSALAYQDRLAVAQRNLADAEEILNAIRARLDVGTASELDVTQQASLVAGIKASIPNLRSNAETQINALGVLVGKLPEHIKVDPGTLDTLSLPEVAPGLPSDLLLRRPDIASAEAQMIAANANMQVARASFYPDISLTATGGWQSAALATLFGPTSLFANAAASATQTIFDNGQLSAQYDLDAAKYDELVADYRKAVVQAFTDVENALTQYKYATEQEALQREAVATAQRAADIARAQVLAGTSDIVTALQTQTTLFSDLDTLAQVRLARFQALVALYKALGGGWTMSDTPVPATKLLQGVL